MNDPRDAAPYIVPIEYPMIDVNADPNLFPRLTKTPGPTLLMDALDTLIYCRNHITEYSRSNPAGDVKSLGDTIAFLNALLVDTQKHYANR